MNAASTIAKGRFPSTAGIPARRVLRAVGFGGLLLLFWPVWDWYLVRMTDGSDEPLGWLALAGAIWLMWERRDAPGPRRGPGAGMVLCLGGYLALLALGAGPLPRALCAVGALGLAATAGRRGRAGILVLLLLSLPVLASVQFYLGYPMRVFAAWMSEAGLGLVGINTEREGTALYRGGVAVLVDAPCSGVRMLWCALALHAFLAARRNLGAVAVALGSAGVVLVVMLGNALRATLLFPKESGMVEMPEWAHEGIGLATFALVCGVVARGHGVSWRMRRPGGRWIVAGGVAAALLLVPLWPERSPAGEAFPGWPTRFEGRTLTEVLLEPEDARFAEGFPGRIARFTDGGRWLIVRWVEKPTRKLHSTADCLRGMGFTIGERAIASGPDESRWASFRAWNRQGEALAVRERITDGAGRGWTDVSEWYWHAMLGKSEGAWWAFTVLE